MLLHKFAVKALAVPTIKRNMPFLTFILSQFLNIISEVIFSYKIHYKKNEI